MISWWTVLIATLTGVTQAVPCWEIQTATLGFLDAPGYQFKHTVTYENALDPDGPWDIVKANDCYVRFQVPRDGGDGRITKTLFEATPQQVKNTMNQYFNDKGTNIALWLPMDSRAFQYGNVLKLTGNNNEDFDGQTSLDINQSVMSIILPSGASQLTEVNPVRGECTPAERINVDQAGSAGIVGLAGTITTADWAYSSGRAAKMAMLTLRRRQAYSQVTGHLEPSWMLAEKADGNCVVIDLTIFVNFNF